MTRAGRPPAADSELGGSSKKPGTRGKCQPVPQLPVTGRDVSPTSILRNLLLDFKTVRVDPSASTVLYTRKSMDEILLKSRSIKLGSKE